MHHVYGHGNWVVIRLLNVPADSLNNVPYLARGWCFCESGVSVVGARQLWTFQDGDVMLTWRSKLPIPLVPQQFNDAVHQLHFTSKMMDVKNICDLYGRIFPKLAEHDAMQFYAWEDDDVEQFLAEVPHLKGLKNVTIRNQFGCAAKISGEWQTKLNAALNERGGSWT